MKLQLYIGTVLREEEDIDFPRETMPADRYYIIRILGEDLKARHEIDIRVNRRQWSLVLSADSKIKFIGKVSELKPKEK